jgi:hypothetical protein
MLCSPPDMRSLIPPSWKLPESIISRIGTSAGRQRLIAGDQHLFLILHAPPDADDPANREARLFWRDAGGAWRASPGEAETTISSLRDHVELFHHAAEEFENEVEHASTADEWFGLLHQLGPFARTTRHLSGVLQQLREHSGADNEVIALRDQMVDVERAAELTYQWASQGLDYAIAKTNEEQTRLSGYLSRASYRLNLLAALTLPLTALGSFLGMNLDNGIEHRGPWLLWGIGAFCLGIGVIMRAWFPLPPEAAVGRVYPHQSPKALSKLSQEVYPLADEKK